MGFGKRVLSSLAAFNVAKMPQNGVNALPLDMPTNELDVVTLRRLEVAIEAYAGCAVIFSHDS